MSDELTPNTPAEHDAHTGAALRPHAYDGIQEYDNSMPMWLTALFFGTVLFALAYIPYYLLGYAMDFDSPQISVAREMNEIKAMRDAEAKAHPPAEPSDTELMALVAKPDAVTAGTKTFKATCVACHGPDGQGLIGPNLTDTAWIHGGKLSQIRHTIVNGVPEKGMVAWGNVLKPDDISNLVAYIHSIQGSNPPNAKPPQGEVVTATN